MAMALRPALVRAVRGRAMSSLAITPYHLEEPESFVFPNERYGCNYDVNWSVTSDHVTPQGDVFAMLPVRNLIMYSSGKPTAARALESADATERASGASTDSFPGFESMSVDDFEDLRDSVAADLSSRKRIFVEDAAVGSYRESEIKVRVISDRPEAALFFRNMLHPVPRYSAESFPRNIVVIDASMHGTGVDGKGAPAEPAVIATDIDPEAPTSAKATVIVRGRVPLSQIMEHVAHCATQLAVVGGYRHLDGAPPAAAAGIERGTATADRYRLADESAPQPSLLVLPGDVFTDAAGTTAVLGANGAVAASRVAAGAAALTGASEDPASVDAAFAAAMAGSGVLAAHHFVWDADRLSSLWRGVAAPTAALGSAALPRGALSLNGGAIAATGLAAPVTLAHPNRLVLCSKDAKLGPKVDRAAFVDAAATLFRMSDDEAALLDARIAASNPELSVVASVEQLLGAAPKKAAAAAAAPAEPKKPAAAAAAEPKKPAAAAAAEPKKPAAAAAAEPKKAAKTKATKGKSAKGKARK
ncbi:hypothetical protein FNF31_07672 [Cafeteria roenbergensis]|uniref:Uncharacterized protein n=1 Tax=Cafeteria roenbergensis TaxID=33653 RepID=A0A5A8C1I9_CAFRO|nr:hypothetical protein FNF31_07672 [Cafeteria roenbergensis]